jgi:cell division protein DivIC
LYISKIKDIFVKNTPMEKEFVDKTKMAISKNRFLLAGGIFFAWIALFDSNSCYDQMKLKNEKAKLEIEKSFYTEKIAEDSLATLELKTDDKNLEKFARENYLMKKDNEDVFVIVEEEINTKQKQ